MKSGKNYYLVLVTAPDVKIARRLARAALTSRLIACANLLPRVEAHFWWQGRIERGNEVLLILKTTKARLATLEQLILELHPYDTPEFLAVPVAGGNARYLAWLTASTGESRKQLRRSPDKEIRGGGAGAK